MMSIRAMRLGGDSFEVTEFPPQFVESASDTVRRRVLKVSSNWNFSCETEHQRFPLAVNSHRESGKILVFLPGSDSSIDGGENKFLNLANYLQENRIACVRTSGPLHGEIKGGPGYEDLLVEKGQTLIEYVFQNAQSIAGKIPEQTEVYLMGYSAGAQGMARVCEFFPGVKKLILVSPAGPLPYESTQSSLSNSQAEITTIAAERDERIQLDVSEAVYRPHGAKFIARMGGGHRLSQKEWYEVVNALLLEKEGLPPDRYLEL